MKKFTAQIEQYVSNAKLKIIAVQNHLEMSFGTTLVCNKILRLEIHKDISHL